MRVNSWITINEDNSLIFLFGSSFDTNLKVYKQLIRNTILKVNKVEEYLTTSVCLFKLHPHFKEYEPLVSKIRVLIQGWATKKLSYAERLQLIKAVIGGVLSFWNQIFLIPAGVIQKNRKPL